MQNDNEKTLNDFIIQFYIDAKDSGLEDGAAIALATGVLKRLSIGSEKNQEMLAGLWPSQKMS